MVVSNMGLPDPPEMEPPLITSNDLTMPVDSDNDDGGNSYEGYERLPMEQSHVESSDDDEEDEVQESENNTESNVPPISPAEVDLIKEVWAGPSVKDIDLDKEKVDQVKAALVNFTLPASNIPDWANKIPEAEWKDEILNRIRNK